MRYAIVPGWFSARAAVAYAMARPLEYWAATEPGRSRDPRALQGGDPKPRDRSGAGRPWLRRDSRSPESGPVAEGPSFALALG